MLLPDVLDALHNIRICPPLGLPEWATQVTVTGRTYSPRHVVCVGMRGHNACAGGPRAEFTLAELDGRGNGGRTVICDGKFNATVELTDAQLLDLEVLHHLRTALVFDRYLAATYDDPEYPYTVEQVHGEVAKARAAAVGSDRLTDLVEYIDGILHAHRLPATI